MGAWMVRAGRNAQYAGKWLDDNAVSIYWDIDGADLVGLSKEEIRARYASCHSDASTQEIATAVGQIWRFANDIVEGERVVMYEPETRLYHVGTIIGACERITDSDGDISYRRAVRWEKESPRDSLKKTSRNSLGAISTIFSIGDEVFADLMGASDRPTVQELDETEQDIDAEIRYATAEDGIERIKDRVMHVAWEDMELLVAGFLRMLGYKTSMTGRGSDGGQDVIASPDGLGLESPRIVAEVKHRKGQIGAPLIRAFIGGLKTSDSGLYVSTGGFTKEARYEADRAPMPIRLLDLDGFVRLFVSNYEAADEETRAILPLARIYWPM
ncbi:restriction endonuclease [Adlercreutzia murintestinalis]|uniref:restriction endonuclease n=1 Tax=Adlercreutzia murintestinalis TaxID=2941325 RepID=UPI0020424E6D|nr:restriction endonuclease [Adlercreutzia murintestinalis]